MRTLFLIAVVSSLGYLVYQESPRTKSFFSTSWFQSNNAEITMESVKHELQKKLDDVTAEREALYDLLAKKEAMLMARTKHSSEKKSVENEVTKPLVHTEEQEGMVLDKGTSQRRNVLQRREALLELAHRMEMQSIGLGVNVGVDMGADMGVDELAVK